MIDFVIFSSPSLSFCKLWVLHKKENKFWIFYSLMNWISWFENFFNYWILIFLDICSQEDKEDFDVERGKTEPKYENYGNENCGQGEIKTVEEESIYEIGWGNCKII